VHVVLYWIVEHFQLFYLLCISMTLLYTVCFLILLWVLYEVIIPENVKYKLQEMRENKLITRIDSLFQPK